MPMRFKLRGDKTVKQIAVALREANTKNRAQTMTVLQEVGNDVKKVMRDVLKPNAYKGTLYKSVEVDVDQNELKVEIGPTAARGAWDAGLIFENGTGPIPRLPFGPIKKWAAVRGVPAGPIWYAIKTRGVKPHPFVEHTLNMSMGKIHKAAEKIGELIVKAYLHIGEPPEAPGL